MKILQVTKPRGNTNSRSELSPQEEWLYRQEKNPYAVENVRKAEAFNEHSYVCKLVKFLYRGLWKFLQKLNRTNIWSITERPKEIASVCQRDTETPAFIATLVIAAKK